ncbi:MATE family efflux transporter [Sphingomonas astaxanthinifaciens]|uniref:MATE family efflux transporter n=1 Tax=Sphingomonas astaxanthinifaciens DSM 22298 TaxID=1123267 RepID=A0ABQ5Z9E6_9SPHN|nr:MATE family efflux transporter [Sphingomonas astaxanthinifaciens]GLR48091.1 MATE family efflux transporter [Sphingomonas astaxanthinifaciens DSM 22298]
MSAVALRPERQQDIRSAVLDGPILPPLARLSLPTIAVLVAQTVVGVAETYYVARLGSDALVGVAAVFPLWMLMTMMSAGGMGGGVAAAVSNAIGAGHHDDADALLFHAVVLAVLIGAGFSAAMWLAGPIIYGALGLQGAPIDEALRYSNWLFLCSVPIWTVNLCSAALRGSGDVKTPARISLAGIVTLVPLSPLLIFGFGPLQGMGITGAGVAVTLFYAAAAVFLLRLLRQGRTNLSLRRHRLDRKAFGRILGVGLLSSLSVVQLNLAVVLVTAAAGHFGAEALAGYGIASRVEYLLVPVLFGLGSAVLTMVGTCTGAGDVARAKRIAIVGTGIAAGFAGAVGLILAARPTVWLGLFTKDPAIFAAGSTYLRIMAIAYPALATAFLLAFVSQGSGRPAWTTIAGTVRLAIAGGLGWLAIFHLGGSYVALALIVACSQAAAALLSIWAFASGKLWIRA